MDSVALATMTELLDLDGFEVVEAESDRKAMTRQLTAVPATAAALCPHCGQAGIERHACHDREVVDLPLGRWKTQLVVRLFQFKCVSCNKYFSPRHAALADGAHATERFLERLADYATHGDLSTAARYLSVPQKTAEGWYYDYLQRREQQLGARKLEPIRCLGIDELSLKKDTGNSVAC